LIINLKNKRYGITGRFDISEDIWTKHLAMHPKRPEEALQNNLSVCYGINSPVTSCILIALYNINNHVESSAKYSKVCGGYWFWIDVYPIVVNDYS
jgi:hypothetical protein